MRTKPVIHLGLVLFWLSPFIIIDLGLTCLFNIFLRNTAFVLSLALINKLPARFTLGAKCRISEREDRDRLDLLYALGCEENQRSSNRKIAALKLSVLLWELLKIMQSRYQGKSWAVLSCGACAAVAMRRWGPRLCPSPSSCVCLTKILMIARIVKDKYRVATPTSTYDHT